MKARPANCECSNIFTCRACLDRAGPTLGDWPTFRVTGADGKQHLVKASSREGAEFIAMNHCIYTRKKSGSSKHPQTPLNP